MYACTVTTASHVYVCCQFPANVGGSTSPSLRAPKTHRTGPKMSVEEKQPLKEEVKQDEGDEEPSQKKEISIPDCTVHSVVVYPDRAEVDLA